MFSFLKKIFARRWNDSNRVRIDVLNEKDEWTHWKAFPGKEPQKEFDAAVKEVLDLNKAAGKSKYRAIIDEGGLTTIYCSGFYVVPTVRFYHWRRKAPTSLDACSSEP